MATELHRFNEYGPWRMALAERPSIKVAVSADYPKRLWQFLLKRRSHLSTLMTETSTIASH